MPKSPNPIKWESWKDGWEGLRCRNPDGTFCSLPDALKANKDANKDMPRRFKFDEKKFAGRAKRLSDKAQALADRIETARSKGEFDKLQRLVEKLEKQRKADQDFIDDFLHDMQVAAKSSNVKARAAAQAAANEIRQALDAKDQWKDIERYVDSLDDWDFPIDGFAPIKTKPRPNSVGKPKVPEISPVATPIQTVTDNKGKKAYKVPSNYHVYDVFKNVPGATPQTKRELSAIYDLMMAGGKANAEKANKLLGKIPGKALEFLSQTWVQVGFEAAMAPENARRIREQGGGKWEVGMGVTARIVATMVENMLNVPLIIRLGPTTERVAERVVRPMGWFLDQDGRGDMVVEGVSNQATKAAKGLDDLFPWVAGDSPPIDITGDRTRPIGLGDEVNDNDAPDRPCVGVQCWIKDL